MKILQLTTFNVEQPNHGGKLRSHHIRKSLRQRFEVETLSFEWGDHEDLASLHVELDKNTWPQLGLDGLTIDWGICTYLTEKYESYQRICELISKYAPEMLLIEQPFLWPLIEKLVDDHVISPDMPIIYSSHNIEVTMKQKFYYEAYPAELAERFTHFVDTIEQNTIKKSIGTIAVSNNDVAYINKIDPNKPARVYLNGHTKPTLRPESPKEKWAELFANREQNWVFVGSWHPPNINGLRDFVAAMSKYQAIEKIAVWVLGAVGNGLQTLPEFDAKEYPWLHIMGPVSADDIETSILLSSGVLLPIWEGGGSNLKTAQALLSGKCIVGATFSFRGFEHCIQEPGVHLADNADNLAKLVLEIKPAPIYERSEAVAQLEWEAVLKNLPDFIEQLLVNNKDQVRI
jgi:hypothetical protein